MDLVVVIEVSVLCVSIYYLYYLIMNYSTIKRTKELYEEYKTWFWYSFIGAIGIIISFQVFWYTDFYNNHPYLEVLIKIILGIFSLINQTLIHDVEKAKKKAKRKKSDDYNMFNTSDKNSGFKLINRLYLLNIVFKFLYKRKK